MPTQQELALMGAPPGGNPPMGTPPMPMGPEGPMGGGNPMGGGAQPPIDFDAAITPTKGKGRIFAEALGAGLAGWGGTGQQYLGRMDTLDLDRRKAMITDGWASYRDLIKGDYDAAAELWKDRDSILTEGGRDATETQYIGQQMRDDPAGVAEGFRQSLVEASEANGVKIPSWAIPSDLEKDLSKLYPKGSPEYNNAYRTAIENKLKLDTRTVREKNADAAGLKGDARDNYILDKGSSTKVENVFNLPGGGTRITFEDGTQQVTDAAGAIITEAAQKRAQVRPTLPKKVLDKVPEAYREDAALAYTQAGGGKDGMVAFNAAKAEGKAKVLRVKSTFLGSRTVLRSASNIRNLVSENPLGATGLGGYLLRDVPGLDAKIVTRQLSAIKAVFSTDRLKLMREQSKTGGAVGQVTIAEWDKLADTFGALDMDMGAEVFMEELEAAMITYGELLAFTDPEKSAAIMEEYGFGAPSAQGEDTVVTSQAQYDALPSGAFYTDEGERLKKP